MIELKCTPEYRTLATGATTTPLAVVVDILTQASTTQRQPFELAFVLDFSGSMAGTKEALLKQSVAAAIDMLHDDDVIHIVAYSTTPTIACDGIRGANKDRLKMTLAALRSDGGTNISAALTVAADLISRGNRQLLRRVFLYTDGIADSGATTALAYDPICTAINEQSITIWTFGIGLDVDADVLQAVAVSGGGHYDFVSVLRIAELTTRAMDGLDKVMGSRSDLVVTTAAGVTVRSVGDHAVAPNYDGFIPLGDVRYASRRQTLLLLDVEGRPDAAADVPLLSLQLQFVPAETPMASIVTVTAAVTVSFAGVRSDADRDVGRLVALSSMGTASESVIALLRGGDVDGARAVLAAALEQLAPFEDGDTTGFVTTQVRRGNRSLDRLTSQGTAAARRVELDLGHQRTIIDRLSQNDMAHSDPGNMTPTGSPTRNPGPDDWNDPDEDMRTPVMTPVTTPRGGVAGESPPPQPIPIPVALLDALLDEYPDDFLCPITKCIMDDPVFTADGQTYQRSAIAAWFAGGTTSSPLTNMPLANTVLTPNFSLRRMIEAWKK